MNSKSILFFCGDGNSLVNFRGNLIKKFIDQGFQVFAIAPNIDISNKVFLNQLGVKLKIVNFERKSINPLSSFKSFINLISIIKAIKPAYTFSYTHKPLVFGALASYFSGVPKIISLVTGTGHIFDHHNLLTKTRRAIGLLGFKLAFKVSTFVIFQNKDDRALFLELGLVNSSKTSIVNGSGVDINHFYPAKFPDGLTFLCLARLIKSKGLQEYAEACRLVKTKIPNARFLLGGAPDMHDDSIDIKEIQNQWMEEYGIEYLGFVDDPREAIKRSSVYMLLSYNEGTPRTVLEAMAMGRPIITTDANGCRETVKNGENGFLVPVFDHKKAAAFMEKFTDKTILHNMGSASRDYCEEKYDVHKVNNEIFKILSI